MPVIVRESAVITARLLHGVTRVLVSVAIINSYNSACLRIMFAIPAVAAAAVGLPLKH
jgi:hypothetical protein